MAKQSGLASFLTILVLVTLPCISAIGQRASEVASVQHPTSNFGFRRGMSKSQIALLCKCKLEHAQAGYELNDKRFGAESDFMFYAHSAPKPDSDFYFFKLGIDPTKGLLYLNALSSSLLFSPSDGDLQRLDQSMQSAVSRLAASYGKPDYSNPDYSDAVKQGEPFWKHARIHLTDCGISAAGPCHWITVAEWKSDVLLGDKTPRGANIQIQFGEGIAPAVMSFFAYRLVVTYDGWDRFLENEAHRQAGMHSITN